MNASILYVLTVSDVAANGVDMILDLNAVFDCAADGQRS